MVRKIEGMKKKGRHKMRWLDGIIDSMDMSLKKLGSSERWGSLACCSPCGLKGPDMTQRLNNNNKAILISTVLLLANIYELVNRWCRWALSGWKIRYCSGFWLISQTDFPDGPVVKNPPASTGDTGSVPGPGRSHTPQGNEASQLLNPTCLEPMLCNNEIPAQLN